MPTFDTASCSDMSEKTEKHEQKQNESGSREELRALLDEFRTAMLVTHDEHGLPRARPMAIVDRDDTSVWFATTRPSPKVREIRDDEKVAVICHRSRDEAWISLSGRATLVNDPEKAKQVWDVGMQAWFSGPDDPALILVRVDPVHAEYYEPQKSLVGRAFEFAKGVVTNEPPKLGTVKHVDVERLSDPGRLSH